MDKELTEVLNRLEKKIKDSPPERESFEVDGYGKVHFEGIKGILAFWSWREYDISSMMQNKSPKILQINNTSRRYRRGFIPKEVYNAILRETVAKLYKHK